MENVWNRLKDELKSALEKSDTQLSIIAVKELKKTECYTSVSYGTFNTLMCRNMELGYSYKESMFFVDFLKTE